MYNRKKKYTKIQKHRIHKTENKHSNKKKHKKDIQKQKSSNQEIKNRSK